MAGRFESTSAVIASLVLAGVITVVWLVSFIADLLNPAYEAPASIHALMMLVGGAAFGSSMWAAGRRNGNGGAK